MGRLLHVSGRGAIVGLWLTSSLTSGCFSARTWRLDSHSVISVADGSPEAERLWEAVKDTLRDHRFRLDRVDSSAGVITTLPVTSQHFFEFWRHDVDTEKDLWESTLNPLRRWVQVDVKRAPNGTETDLTVMVHKQRLSSPDRQFNSSGAAYQVFGDRLPSTTGKPRLSSADDRWLDQGRDSAMESYFLSRILERAGLSSAVLTRAEHDGLEISKDDPVQ